MTTPPEEIADDYDGTEIAQEGTVKPNSPLPALLI